MIRIIDKTEYRSKIMSLWSECFGDSRDYIEFFLDSCPSECVAYTENGRLVSMLFLLEGHIDNFMLKYIYAACTDKQYRNRGIMGQLIEFVKSYCIEHLYDGIFLVPGEESLYGYYVRFGFESHFFRNDFKLNGSPDITDFTECNDVELISRLRTELLSETNSFLFDEKTLKYSIKEHFYNGGKVLIRKVKDIVYLVFCYYDNKNFIIKELLCSEQGETLKIFEHFTNSDTENVYIRCPIVYNNTDNVAECTKCGMCFFLNDELKSISLKKDFYAGLYLD